MLNDLKIYFYHIMDKKRVETFKLQFMQDSQDLTQFTLYITRLRFWTLGSILYPARHMLGSLNEAGYQDFMKDKPVGATVFKKYLPGGIDEVLEIYNRFKIKASNHGVPWVHEYKEIKEIINDSRRIPKAP